MPSSRLTAILTTLITRKVRKIEIIPPYCVILGKLFKHCLTFHSTILKIYCEDKMRYLLKVL